MKIIVDIVLSKNSFIATVAVIAWNNVDSFLEVSTVAVEGISEPETMEVLACREGLALTSDFML